MKSVFFALSIGDSLGLKEMSLELSGFMVAVLLSTCPEAGDALWEGVRKHSSGAMELIYRVSS